MSRNLLWCMSVVLLLSACASKRLDLNRLAPDSDLATHLPISSTVLVYVAVPYFDKDSKRFTRKFIARKLINEKNLKETSLAVSKKYFSNARVFSPDKKANYFIFLSGESYVAEFSVVSTIRGQIYDADGQLIYNNQAIGREITASLINEASFYNAAISAQVNFYDSFFKSQPRMIQDAHTEKSVSISTIADKLDKEHIRDIGTASGFVINTNGDVLTNYHTIANCLNIDLHLGKSQKPATVLYIDKDTDLAVLGSHLSVKKPAVFSDAAPPRLGDNIVIIGFPLHGVLSSQPSLSTGNISALAGIKENQTVYQITAPVQQGNSGGPVLNSSGAVIGIVQSKLNAIALAEYTGDIPQNVNFAIKQEKVISFLKQYKIKYSTIETSKTLTTPDIAESATAYTVELSCRGYADPSRN